jgi:hypothetical protein
VFFNGLSHVGVVADEKGFYHASRHNGVVYATFEGYWESTLMVSVGCHYLSAGSPTKGTKQLSFEL